METDSADSADSADQALGKMVTSSTASGKIRRGFLYLPTENGDFHSQRQWPCQTISASGHLTAGSAESVSIASNVDFPPFPFSSVPSGIRADWTMPRPRPMPGPRSSTDHHSDDRRTSSTGPAFPPAIRWSHVIALHAHAARLKRDDASRGEELERLSSGRASRLRVVGRRRENNRHLDCTEAMR